MSSTVNWSFNLSVLNGPSVSIPDSLSVSAYDSINVSIPNDGATNSHEVQLTSLTSADNIAFIIINSSQYDQSAESSGETFQYTVTVGATTGAETTLDGPQFLMSPALAGLLIPVPASTTTPVPVYLTFTNKTTAPANVSILIGRTA